MNTISTYVNDRLHYHHGQSPWHEAADRLSMTPPPRGERPLDGTATGRVTTKEPPLAGKRVPAVLACIAEWFPQAFVPETRRLLDLVAVVPTPVWGRDELVAGEMWNSNSLIAWLIARAGLATEAIQPPAGGRAPGWDAGLVVASRQD